MSRRPPARASAAALAAAAWILALSIATPAEAAPVVRTLENGLEVAVFPDQRTPVVQVVVMVAGGSVRPIASAARRRWWRGS